jgi:predicted CopG family antitoxin
MPEELVLKPEKSGNSELMKKLVQKKADGRTIIFYSFAKAASTDCEGKIVTERNTSSIEG